MGRDILGAARPSAGWSGGLLAALAILAGAGAAMADAQTTLLVSARVVDSCEVATPAGLLPGGAWNDPRTVEQRCIGRPVGRVHAERRPHRAAGVRHSRPAWIAIARGARAEGELVLVTVSY